MRKPLLSLRVFVRESVSQLKAGMPFSPRPADKMRILIVDDDVRLADVLRRSLAESGHVVDVEHNGETGETAALDGLYDAIILDVMLPGKDGLTVLQRLRHADVRTPILMLTARDTIQDVVVGLDAGADDYLRKPFDLEELEARLRTIRRRDGPHPNRILRVADVELDLATMTVRRAGRTISMTARETAFLEYFMRHSGQVVTRRMIEDALWERERDSGASNVIDVFIRRLRAKLTQGEETPLIHTVRGEGYRFASLDF
jgi:DNA-binding response OmpR family regulator